MSNSLPKTLSVKPYPGEMIKPAELIDLSDMGNLTLSARRMYNALIANAFGPQMASEGYEFTIALADLRGTHDSNDRISESINALMRTIVMVRMPDGGERRFALLGGNDMDSPSRAHGIFKYSFDPRLAAVLADSTIFGKLDLKTMMCFSKRYSLALYEAIARRSRLDYVFSEEFSLEEFRTLLGVPDGKLSTFGNLNNRCIKPAVAEVNAYASFGIKVMPIKTGRRVTGVHVGWWTKNDEELAEAFQEISRHSAGRKARLNGSVEEVQQVVD